MQLFYVLGHASKEESKMKPCSKLFAERLGAVTPAWPCPDPSYLFLSYSMTQQR